MFMEWIKFRLVPSPSLVRGFGYPQELIALEARLRRCRHAWGPHLQASRAAVTAAITLAQEAAQGTAQGTAQEAAQGTAQADVGGGAAPHPTGPESSQPASSRPAPSQPAPLGRAVVLGSGLLAELPLDQLSAAFREVLLVDIVHLPWVAKPAKRRFPNVRFFTADVTGAVHKLGGCIDAVLRGAPPPPLPEAWPGLALGDTPVDLIVSANILSQLPLRPIDYLERRLGADHPYDEAALNAFAHGLMRAHLDWACQKARHVCVFTDSASIVYDREEQEIERNWRIDPALLPNPDQTWIWDIAPPGEFRRRQGQRRQMVAIHDLNSRPHPQTSGPGSRPLSPRASPPPEE